MRPIAVVSLADGGSALEWAVRAALRARAELTVYFPTNDLDEQDRRDTTARCEEAVRRATGRAGPVPRAVEPLGSEPADALAQLSHEGAVSLIVVDHQESHLPDLLHTGFADRLVEHVAVPVALVPQDVVMPAPDGRWTMVVGLEGGEADNEALAGISSLASALNARTVPVLAVNTGASTSRHRYGSLLVGESAAAAEVPQLPNAEPLRELNESPVGGLLEVAEEVDAAIIAVGRHSRHRLLGLVNADVPHRLARRSPRAVVISPSA